MTYSQGHVKRNPDTGEVAVRTQYPEGLSSQMDAMAWCVASPTTGPRSASTDEVGVWTDLVEVTP